MVSLWFWLCESPIFGWFTFPFSENSPVILWMKSTFLDDFSNNFCFLTYCATKISKLLSLTAPLEEVSDRQRRLDAPLATFVRLVKKWEPSFRGKWWSTLINLCILGFSPLDCLTNQPSFILKKFPGTMRMDRLQLFGFVPNLGKHIDASNRKMSRWIWW